MIYAKESSDTFRIERHTGNKIMRLQLKIASEPCTPKINILTQPENEEVNLHADEILFYVEDSVNGIYERFQRRFYIAEISFYPSDSPPAGWYAYLTFELLKFVIQQETNIG